MNLRFLFFFLAIITFNGCIHKRLERDVEKFKGQQVELFLEMKTFWKGKDTVVTGFLDAPVKLVVWYDSLSCLSCEVGKMDAWHNIVSYADTIDSRFRIILLFTPRRDDYFRVFFALRASRFDYPIYLDRHSTFIKQNPNLPKNRRLHSFLLDKNNRVVLLGNPLYNPALWALYKRTIQEMIENDGVLPDR